MSQQPNQPGRPQRSAGPGNESPEGPAASHGFTAAWLAESMTHASIDSMIALDAGLRVIAWNDTTERWSGLPFAEVAGRPLFEIFPQAEAIGALKQAFENALLGYGSFLPAGGETYLPGVFETHVLPLRDPGGLVQGVLQITHDISHRLKAEQELKQLHAELVRQYAALQQANEELAGFARVAAHDLKEPLRKIYSFVEAIMMQEAGKLSNSGRSNFRRIQRGVQRMGLLTDDLVTFASLSQADAPVSVDLSALLESELKSRRSEIEQTGAHIRCAPLPVVQGHPMALKQLLRQLLSNALKFRRPGTAPVISVECDRVSAAETGEPGAKPGALYWHLRFADNGTGFDPAEASRMFGLFQRLHGEERYPGNGTGLAIARKAVQLHGGFIRAESVPGEGSTFHCYLRCADGCAGG